MILRYPDYYEKFQCIAGDCEDTCCAGWEIDIDDESYERYKQVPGEFGRRLRESIKEYETEEDVDIYEKHGFCLTEEKRCPFLNQKNLCDIILELGEESICYVCTHTPRNYFEYDGAREISLSPSCPEAARLIFSRQEPVHFIEKEIEERLDFEESVEELCVARAVKRARDVSIFLLQRRIVDGRKKKIQERIREFLIFSKKVQEYLNHEKIEEIIGFSEEVEQGLYDSFLQGERERIIGQLDSKETASVDPLETEKYHYHAFCRRMKLFSGLDSVNEGWKQLLKRLDADFLEDITDPHAVMEQEDRYTALLHEMDSYIEEKDLEYLYEQLFVYYAYLMLPRAMDDGNFWGKVQFVAVSFFMVRDMNMETFLKKEMNERFTEEDFMRNVRFFAKEIEHSEENIELLEEEFLFEDVYEAEQLIFQV